MAYPFVGLGTSDVPVPYNLAANVRSTGIVVAVYHKGDNGPPAAAILPLLERAGRGGEMRVFLHPDADYPALSTEACVALVAAATAGRTAGSAAGSQEDRRPLKAGHTYCLAQVQHGAGNRRGRGCTSQVELITLKDTRLAFCDKHKGARALREAELAAENVASEAADAAAAAALLVVAQGGGDAAPEFQAHQLLDAAQGLPGQGHAVAANQPAFEAGAGAVVDVGRKRARDSRPPKRFRD